jgi:iturin family lipopeptide synthetase A
MASPTTGITYVDAGRAMFETYAQLLASARRTLGALQKLGFEPGQPLVMQISERQVHFHLVWGCILGGIVPVTIAIPPKYEANNAIFCKLTGVIAQLDARHVMSSTCNVGALVQLLPSKVHVHDAAQLDRNVPDGEVVEATVTPDDVVFYQLTSGSTGVPKCIPERHSAIISHIRHSIVHCEYRPEDVTLNWLPFDHVVPMLTFHLKDCYLGSSAVQLPTAQVIADPLLWMRTIEMYRVTHSWAPNFGFKLVAQAIEKAGGAFTHDLSSVKWLMNAGEQVTAGVCDAFLNATRLPGGVMQPAFGMAEVCTCMTYNNEYGPSSTLYVTKESLQANDLCPVPAGSVAETLAFMDLGPPSPGVEIRICSDDGTTLLRERQVGHFHIRGPCVMQGYYNHPKANAESFVAGGWFDSGDLGFLHGGRLFLTGRAKEMIIIRGANYYCYEIEELVTQVQGTVPARVAATSIYNERIGTEELLVFFVPDEVAVQEDEVARLHLDVGGRLDGALVELVSSVRTHITKVLSLTPKHVIPVTDASFHRTTSGKIQRGAFKKEFAEGVHAAAVSALAASHCRCTLDDGRATQIALYVISWAPLTRTLALRSSSPHLERASRCLLELGVLRHRRGCALLGSFDQSCKDVTLLLRDAGSLVPAICGVVTVLSLLQEMTAAESSPALTVVTVSVHRPTPLGAEMHLSSVALSAGWGLVPVVLMEHPHLQIISVDCSRYQDATEVRTRDVHETQISCCDVETFVARLRRDALVPRNRGKERLLPGAYVVIGGLGGLGLHVAPWLLFRGAEAVTLTSRSGHISRHGQGLEGRLDALCSDAVDIVCADASEPRDVVDMVGRRHVVAGQLYVPHVEGGDLIRSISGFKFVAIFSGKALGGWHVHASLEVRLQLRISIVASSVATFGGVRSAPYSAANAFLDGLARAGVSRGRALRCANLPVLLGAGTGASAFARQLGDETSAHRAIALSMTDAIRVVDYITGVRSITGAAHAPLPVSQQRTVRGLAGIWLPKSRQKHNGLLAEVDAFVDMHHPSTLTRLPSKSSSLQRPELLQQVLALLRETTGQAQVDLDTPFMEAGVDSLMAADFVGQLSSLAGTSLSPTLIFEHSTVRAAVRHLEDSCAVNSAPDNEPGCRQLKVANSFSSLALRGTAYMWPGSCRLENPCMLQKLLSSAGDAVARVPLSRWSHDEALSFSDNLQVPTSVGYGSFVARAERFDHIAFGVSAAETAAMDPQHRLLLETSYSSLHSIGNRRATLTGNSLGVFLGVERPDWPLLVTQPTAHLSVYAATGDTISVAGGRLPFVLGLHGPCVSLDSACSSSIAATHIAAHTVQANECSAAVVESVSLKLHVRTSLIYANAGMLSADGRCKTLDASANGYVRAEGVGAFVLQHHEKAAVEAHFRGSAVCQDGRSASLTAPNGSAQRVLLRKAMVTAKVASSALGAVEMHGTGTPLGDPTEVSGLLGELNMATRSLILGASKSSFGHMEPAAGMLGLVKAVKDLCAGSAGIAHLARFNPLIQKCFSDAIALVPEQHLDVERTMLAKGISAFGYSGTIAHALLARDLERVSAPSEIVCCCDFRRRSFACRATERQHDHPMMQIEVSSHDGCVFRSPVSGGLFSLVADHVLNGRVVFPATAYLEMLRAAISANAARALHGVEVGDVFWIRPMMLAAYASGTIECEIRINGRFEVRRFKAASTDASVHCMGAGKAVVPSWQATDVCVNRVHSSLVASVPCLAATFHHSVGLQYGPTYRVLISTWRASGHGRALARLRQRVEWQGTQVHPADLDCTLQLFLLTVKKDINETMLPYTVHDATLCESDGKLWSVRTMSHEVSLPHGMCHQPFDATACDTQLLRAIRSSGGRSSKWVKACAVLRSDKS